MVDAGLLADLARLIGLQPCSGSRAHPALDLAARPVRGVACQGHRIPSGQRPSGIKGPRRHAALGLLVAQARESVRVSSRLETAITSRRRPDLQKGSGLNAASPSRLRSPLPCKRARSQVFRPASAPAVNDGAMLETARNAREASERGVQRFVYRSRRADANQAWYACGSERLGWRH